MKKKTIKNILIYTILISSTILMWCSDKTRFEFSFDNFNSYFITQNSFNNTQTKTKWLAASLLDHSIIANYSQTNWSWYTDSIIIIQKTSSQNLQKFVTQNIDKIKLEGYTTQSPNESTFRCDDKKIKIQTIDSQLETNLNTVFFSQAFFIYNQKAYIVSFSSDQEKERNTFTSNIKNISCN
jgi:hypothetical protein